MGAATALAGTHLPHVDEPRGVYKNTEPAIWSRQGSVYVHRTKHCRAGTPRSPARSRLISARLAIAWKRRACRTCMPQGIPAALAAGHLPVMHLGAPA